MDPFQTARQIALEVLIGTLLKAGLNIKRRISLRYTLLTKKLFMAIMYSKSAMFHQLALNLEFSYKHLIITTSRYHSIYS